MAKTATVRARIDPELKLIVERILWHTGITVSEAIIIYFKQIEHFRGLPFKVDVPNFTTLQTLDDTDDVLNLVFCESSEDLLQGLGL